MAYIFRRGELVPFTQSYYDSTGGLVTPTSATVTITYPSTHTGDYPYVDQSWWTVYSNRWKTTTLELTTNSSGELYGEWASSVSWPGWVWYHITPSNSSLGVVDGSFELRGNPANRFRS